MQTRLKRWSLIGAGWLCILIGIAGGFIPILQGWVFILAGLVILSTEYVWAHKLISRLLHHFPRLERHVESARAKAHAWSGKIHHHRSDSPSSAVSNPDTKC